MAQPLDQLGIGNVGISSGMFLKLFDAFFWIAVIVFIGVALYIILYFRQFNIRTTVHNVRDDGKIWKKKTRGGFVKNPISKIETFKILSHLKAVIKPFPNNMIGRDEKGRDHIHLVRTAHDEYIPATLKHQENYIDYKKEKIVNEDGTFSEKIVTADIKDFRHYYVYREYAKGWLKIKMTEIRKKFNYADFIEKYGVVISLGFIVVIFIIGLRWMGERMDVSVGMVQSIARQVTTGAP